MVGEDNAAVIRETQASRQEGQTRHHNSRVRLRNIGSTRCPLLLLTLVQDTQAEAAASLPLLVLNNVHSSDFQPTFLQQAFRKALEISPFYAEAHNNLAFSCSMRSLYCARVKHALAPCPHRWQHLSAHDSRIHFGLGPDPNLRGVLVHWPGGMREAFEGIKADTIVTLKQRTGKLYEGKTD